MDHHPVTDRPPVSRFWPYTPRSSQQPRHTPTCPRGMYSAAPWNVPRFAGKSQQGERPRPQPQQAHPSAVASAGGPRRHNTTGIYPPCVRPLASRSRPCRRVGNRQRGANPGTSGASLLPRPDSPHRYLILARHRKGARPLCTMCLAGPNALPAHRLADGKLPWHRRATRLEAAGRATAAGNPGITPQDRDARAPAPRGLRGSPLRRASPPPGLTSRTPYGWASRIYVLQYCREASSKTQF